MNRYFMKPIIMIFALSFLAACSSQGIQQEEYSGFMSDEEYNKVVKVELEGGDVVYRWIAPDFNPQDYSAIIVENVQFYPDPDLSDQVNQTTLDEISDYITAKLKSKLGEKRSITDKAGPGVANLSTAITGVSVETEGMKATEVLPMAAIYGAMQAATGIRDRVVEVYLEGKVTNAQTGEVLGLALRKIRGKNLQGLKDSLTLDDVKESLDGAAADVLESITSN